jgi:hypothetical protein
MVLPPARKHREREGAGSGGGGAHEKMPLSLKRVPRADFFFSRGGRGCCSLVAGDTAVVCAAAGPTTAEAGSAAPAGIWGREGGSGGGVGEMPVGGAGKTTGGAGDVVREALRDAGRLRSGKAAIAASSAWTGSRDAHGERVSKEWLRVVGE